MAHHHRNHARTRICPNQQVAVGVTLLTAFLWTLVPLLKSVENVNRGKTLDSLAAADVGFLFQDGSSANHNSTTTLLQKQRRFCIVVRTTFPIPPYALKMVDRMAQDLYTFDKEDEYDLVLRVDETNQTGAHEALDRYLSRTASGSKGRKRIDVSTISLPTLLGAFHPTLRAYLYNASVNTHGDIGDCCNKPPMWQLAVPNDVHFVLHHGKQYEHVWVVEDDLAMVGSAVLDDKSTNDLANATATPITTLAQLLMAKDRELSMQRENTSFVAVQSAPIVDDWMRSHHTHEFESLLRQSSNNVDSRNVAPRRFSVSDGLRRISPSAANALYDAIVEKGQFALVETFVYPVLSQTSTQNRAQIHLWKVPRLRHLVNKLDEDEARAAVRHSQLSWALYQQLHTPARRLIITFSSFQNAQQTLLFLRSYQAKNDSLHANLYILTDVAPNDPTRKRFAMELQRARATIVDTRRLVQKVQARESSGGNASFFVSNPNMLKVLVLERWLKQHNKNKNAKQPSLFGKKDKILVTDEDVVFSHDDQEDTIFSAMGTFQNSRSSDLLAFSERGSAIAHFHHLERGCWDQRMGNATFAKSGTMILAKGKNVYGLYKWWSAAVMRYVSPECNRTKLKPWSVNPQFVDSQRHPYWVLHLTTAQNDQYSLFRNGNFSMVHQFWWCKECMEDMERQFGLAEGSNASWHLHT